MSPRSANCKTRGDYQLAKSQWVYFGNNCLCICSELHQFLLFRDALFSNPKVSLGRTLGSTVLASAFLPGECHGQSSLAAYSPWGRKETQQSDWARTHTSNPVYLLWGSQSLYLTKSPQQSCWLERGQIQTLRWWNGQSKGETDKKMDNYTVTGAVKYGAGTSNLH